MIHVLLTGGGTGGHTYPLIAVARALRKQNGDADTVLRYIGPKGPMMEAERAAFEAEGIPATFISAGKVRRYAALQNVIDPFRTLWGIVQALYFLVRDVPDVVFAKGGYGAVPVVVAAWLYRIPIMIHESDAVPGVANRMMGKLARRIGITYHHAEQYFRRRKTALVGVPVRETVLHGDAARARERFHLMQERPVVLFIGGSQGARVINKAVIAALQQLHERVQVVHQTGEKNYDDVVHAAARKGFKAGRDGYTPVAFLTPEEMGDALAVADIVVSRAGASAIAEIAAYKKASILVPLNLSANDHQRMNAYEIAKVGGTVVLEETNIGRAMLTETIFNILDNLELRTTLEQRIAAFYHPLAADHIAQGLLEMADV